MNIRIVQMIAATVLIVCTPVRARASDLDLLQGKWALSKTNQEGQAYSQVLEIDKDQLTFQILDAGSSPRFFSKGTVRVTKAAPFDVLTITDIRAGRSADDVQPVNESFATVYTLRDGNLFFASNFDKARDNQQPNVEMYVRKATATPDPEAKILGKWKLDLTMGDNAYDYVVRITKPNNRLQAVMVSPRSGEHPCQVVRFNKGDFVMEVEREIQGTQATFVYEGKLTGDSLAGKAQVKGQEDQLSGTWKAAKVKE